MPQPAYLVPIQSGTGNPPLYMVHSIAGELTWTKQLAHDLGPTQPIYTFAAPGLNSEAPFFCALESMATAYLRDIRAHQPTGPYLLGGYSMGGVIAFEMARQLIAGGEKVALLAMIDAFAPRPAHQDSIVEWSRNGLLLQVICNQLGLQWKADRLLPPDALPGLPFTEHSQCAAQHLLKHCDIPHSAAVLQTYLRRCQIMMRVHAQLLFDYHPTPISQVDQVVLFRNTKGLIGRQSTLALPVLPDCERDPPHGWENLLHEPPVSIQVHEEHFMLGSTPSIHLIGESLRQVLAANRHDTA